MPVYTFRTYERGRKSIWSVHDNTMSADKQTGLAVDFCGLSFQSPVVLLSGCVGLGNEYTRVQGFSHQDVGRSMSERNDFTAAFF